MDGLCWLQNLVVSGDTMAEMPGPGYRNALLSERNRLSRWQPHVLGFLLAELSQEASLFRSWYVHAAPKAGGAGSSSGLLWILPKPQDCSKALDWLGYSLVDRPQAAWQSHELHLTVPITAIIWLKAFLLSFSSSVCFSLCGFDPGIHLACCGFPVWER